MDRSQVKARDVASRIDLDYYKKPDRVYRRKKLLAGIAGIAAAAWVVTMFLPGKGPISGSGERFSHGGICEKHAAFANECSACHVSFSGFSGKKAAAEAVEKKCTECHFGDKGAVHSPIQLAEKTPNCGVCHTDHKGADFDIKRVADGNCTECHKALDKAMSGATASYDKTVSSFASQHPEFRSLTKKDPGNIKFNHKYHMTNGIVLASGGKEFKVREMQDGPMKTALLARVGSGGASSAVRLECADCHTPDGNDPLARTTPRPKDPLEESAKVENRKFFDWKQQERGWLAGVGTLKPPRKQGAYMNPINYDANCAACHPLTFGAGLKVEHRLSIDQLKEQVATLAARSTPPMPKIPFLGLPGKSPGFDAGDKVQIALRSLLEGKRVCGECHVSEDGSDLTASSKAFAKSNIPTQWFEHARFDHSKHKDDMDCRDCHAQAYAYKDAGRKEWDGKGVLDSHALPRNGAELVMNPDIKNCRECHSPTATKKPAKHDCTECHGYHNGTPPKATAERRMPADHFADLGRR